MLTRRHVQRSVALLASVGASAALTLVPADGAHASVMAEYAAVGDADASYVGPTSGGSCTLTSGDESPEGPIRSFSHGTKKSSVDLSATFTSSDNSSDQVKVKGHVDTSLTLHRKHHDLSSFALSGGGSLSVRHTLSGSACQGRGSVVGEVGQLVFTEHKKGWFYLTRDTKKPNSFAEFILVNAKSGALISLDLYSGTASHVTSRARLKPGKYAIVQTEVGLAIGGVGVLKSADLSRRATQTVHLKGEFKPKKH